MCARVRRPRKAAFHRRQRRANLMRELTQRCEEMSAGPAPALSVLLPVYNAMPYLPIAVRDMLKQRLADDAPLELLVAFDGGDDGSLAFLLALVAALGDSRARDEVCTPPPPISSAAPSNPALLQPLRASEAADHPSFAAAAAARPAPLEPPSVAEVAAACRPEHSLRVLRYADGANRGQGAAMSLALSRARGALVAQMESDDERARDDAFARMVAALDAHPDWDGVSCAVELVGWERPGMAAYVAWQNSLVTPEQMAAERFVEIPALHQAALFRRRAVDAALAASDGAYRDGPRRAEPAAPGDALDTPVDLWWWLAFFDLGLRCGKLEGPPLLGWRQHPRQHTRTHGRLALDQLRKVKAHFLLRAGGPAHGAAQIEVWSTGETLRGWVDELQARVAADVSVRAVEWKPGAPPPDGWRGRKRKAADGDAVGRGGVVRLFAFGMAKARAKARAAVRDWDAALDWFVA